MGGGLIREGPYFEILLFGGSLFREERLSESGSSLDHLRYQIKPGRWHSDTWLYQESKSSN